MAVTGINNIHPEIIASEKEIGRWNGPKGYIVKAINPGFGLGSKPTDGLVDIHYRCTDVTEWHDCKGAVHTATYGPKVIAFGDDCVTCGRFKWSSHTDHDYKARGEEILDRSHYELYAD